MAAIITYADVVNGFSTTVPQTIVESVITTIDAADTCLDANSVAEATQELLKIAAVRHILVMMDSSASGKGSITSESAPSGASRSFKSAADGSTYLNLIKQIDIHGCVSVLLENNKRLSLYTIGRRAT